MNNSTLLGPWVRRFLLEHIVGERNLAANTQHSYRDMLGLLIPFTAKKLKKPVDQLDVTDLSADLLRLFLADLEASRKCGIATRNQRLGAIHALATFIGGHSPEYVQWSGEARSIPFKKTGKAMISYLEKPEMDALLASPDPKSSQGRRDHALLLFLYNSGCRATEAAQLQVGDLDLRAGCVKITGKGRKQRCCPLWTVTVRELTALVGHRAAAEPVFLNRCGQPITRFGIHTMVERYAQIASVEFPAMASKRVSPHSIRHTSATHLLRAGVDINTIRGWLGHVSLDTTNVYAEIDLETKAKALAMCAPNTKSRPIKPWRSQPGLMDFLRSL